MTAGRILSGVVVACAFAVLGGCGSGQDGDGKVRSLEEIKASGELRVVTRNGAATRYLDRVGDYTGPEHDLVTAFADRLGVEVVFDERPTVAAVLAAVREGAGDLGAAGITITEARRERFRFGPPYQRVTQQVVCRRDTAQPESVEELLDLDVRVIAESSYVERLRTLRENDHAELQWQAVDDATTETLLRRVAQGRFDCTVADSNIVDINRRYFPELIAPMNLSREQKLGWVMPPAANELQRAAREWLKAFRNDGRLEALHEEYYGFFREFDYVDISRYVRRIDQRFPQYRKWFRQAAEKHDLPFTVIAAQGYQESHWRADARSPTGVRGIMMLTQPTARAMGVENRLNPKQSIFGGAKYLARMTRRFSEEVKGRDRIWLALAAYNVGRAHMHDAQVLARERGLDPHRWRGIKQVLPLLSKPEFYRDLKYGYARGQEPVRYVRRIREYRHVLENQL